MKMKMTMKMKGKEEGERIAGTGIGDAFILSWRERLKGGLPSPCYNPAPD